MVPVCQSAVAMKPQWARRSETHSKPQWISRARRSGKQIHTNNRLRYRRAWTHKTLQSRLVESCLPPWWIALCLQAAAGVRKMPLIIALEVFSGKGEMSKALGSLCGPSCSFDVINGPSENILSEEGLLILLKRFSGLSRWACYGLASHA